MKKYLIPVLLLAAAVIAACSGSPATGANQITLEVSNLQYQPATIEVTAGQLVRMTMRNDDSIEHDFSIMEIPMARWAQPPRRWPATTWAA
jgi:plastocyanin